jgi:streptogramin lyase
VTTNRLGTWTSPARAAAGVVSLAAGLMLASGNALAAVGDITEYPTPTANSNPYGIAAGPDGNLWFVEYNASRVAKVTTSGAITEYLTPTVPSNPTEIAAGPDGNLWFTEDNRDNGKVAKVTTAGAFTEYPIPTYGSSYELTHVVAFGIVAGPDGNLWFTKDNAYGTAGAVDKVTTAGAFTEYPIPTANSMPRGIAAGPDGNLWFIEFRGNNVAKMTTSGDITEYAIPTANSAPQNIAAGPDGNLWFTEGTGNKVAKITTAGAITEYPVPTANSYPYSIAAGLDGNLWFTEYLANRVAKVTTSGAFTEYPTPTANSSPYYIAAGPDGNIWFTEVTANKVAKVSVQVAAAATFNVTNCNDSGAGSLRDAVSNAASGETIAFALSPSCSVITETSGAITIATNLTITGPGASTLAVSGNHTNTVFAVNGGVTATISGLTVEDGSANNLDYSGSFGNAGGGIYNNGTLTVTDSTLSDNSATFGGAIANLCSPSIPNCPSAILTVTDSTVSNNSATVHGGGILNGGLTTVTDSTLSDNSAGYGGGISNFGTTTVTDSTLSGNQATGSQAAQGYGGTFNGNGGGIFNFYFGPLTVTHATLSGNSASNSGGGIYSYFSTASLVATIVANSGAAGDCSGGVTDGGYNLADDGSCGFSSPSLSNTPAGLAQSLANNGGPTLTLALEPGSAAVGAVTDASDCTGTDQRGVPWPTPCNIGAIGSTAAGPAPQTISFTSTAPANATYGGPSYTVTATGGGSGNPVTFSIDSSASSVCSVSGSTVSFIGVGTCVIDANQAGNANYLAAAQAQQSFAVGQSAQAITFNSTPPPNAIYGGPAYTVTPTGGGSGNPVTFSIDSAATSVCSISGSTVSFIGVGTCIIDANQAGNADYLAAPQVQQSFAVTQAPQTISFPAIPLHLIDSKNTPVSDTITAAASSGLQVTVISSTTSVCNVSNPTLSGGTTTWTLTVTAVGNCTLTASQAGNANYFAAPNVTQSLQVARLLTMGPQAMEGDLKLSPGTTLKVGYDFTIPGAHPSDTISFSGAKVVFTYTCTGSTNRGTFTVAIPDATVVDSANSSAWYPSGNQSDPSVYQASISVPNVCPSGSLVRLQQGGTFSTGVNSSGTDNVHVRWHYSANGSSGSWSGTATVVPS